jgi:hypothetical protein
MLCSMQKTYNKQIFWVASTSMIIFIMFQEFEKVFFLLYTQLCYMNTIMIGGAIFQIKTFFCQIENYVDRAHYLKYLKYGNKIKWYYFLLMQKYSWQKMD